MNCLTVDFGSTFTKLTSIDLDKGEITGTANAFTTIETDVKNGFYAALSDLKSRIPDFKYDKLICCSSAAGGLKMVALGLVPELTSKAAKMAASSAGAKVIKTYSFEISKSEQDEIFKIDPDIVLLCGGTDGGNKEVIIQNAKRLCEIERNFSVIVAGNKCASYELEEIFKNSGKDYVITNNVMPTFNNLEIEPARQSIKNLFIRKIVDAKGLSAIREMSGYDIIPTPLAVMTGCELLSKGTKHTSGLGDLIAVDIGGATTDVYSMSKGVPTLTNTVQKGVQEPFSKRTVEGDLGMRYSLSFLVDEIDMELFSQELSVPENEIRKWIARCYSDPSTVAAEGSIEMLIEEGLSRKAIEFAFERHCGTIDKVYTPMGEVFALTGKDLSNVNYVIGTGGVLVKSKHPDYILGGIEYNPSKYNYMKPKEPKYMLDEKYIFASMGLLSSIDPEMALRILKNEIKII